MSDSSRTTNTLLRVIIIILVLFVVLPVVVSGVMCLGCGGASGGLSCLGGNLAERFEEEERLRKEQEEAGEAEE